MQPAPVGNILIPSTQLMRMYECNNNNNKKKKIYYVHIV